MSTRHVAIVVVGVAAATIAVWLVRIPAANDGTTPAAASEAAVPEAAKSQDSPSPGVPGPAVSRDDDSCLSAADLRNGYLPIHDDLARLDKVLVNGSSMDSYRGLSRGALENLAVQEDAAAMATLGAMAMLRATGQSESRAIALLRQEDPALAEPTAYKITDEQARAEMRRAYDWLYRAALHGRPGALKWAGRASIHVFGTPVERGWVTEADWEEMPASQRSALLPWNVYQRLEFELLPALATGPFGKLASDMTPASERQERIVQRLARRFRQDLENRGLSLTTLHASPVPPADELFEAMCEPLRKTLSQGPPLRD